MQNSIITNALVQDQVFNDFNSSLINIQKSGIEKQKLVPDQYFYLKEILVLLAYLNCLLHLFIHRVYIYFIPFISLKTTVCRLFDLDQMCEVLSFAKNLNLSVLFNVVGLCLFGDQFKKLSVLSVLPLMLRFYVQHKEASSDYIFLRIKTYFCSMSQDLQESKNYCGCAPFHRFSLNSF